LGEGGEGEDRRKGEDFGDPRMVGHGTLLTLCIDAGMFGGSYFEGKRNNRISRDGDGAETIGGEWPGGRESFPAPENLRSEGISKIF
jgi:hypothetical protein